MLQMLGVSVVPTKIDLKCGVCSEVIDSITDPPLLKRYRAREPRPEER